MNDDPAGHFRAYRYVPGQVYISGNEPPLRLKYVRDLLGYGSSFLLGTDAATFLSDTLTQADRRWIRARLRK